MVGGNLIFWRHFFKDNNGLKNFEAKQKLENKQRSKKRKLDAHSAPILPFGGGPSGGGPSGGGPSDGRPSCGGNRSNVAAQVKRPLQQPQPQPHMQKRSIQDPVSDQYLQFAVYVEKFEKNMLVKMSGKE